MMERLLEYIENQIPAVSEFALRVAAAILVFWLGRKIIGWVLKVMKGSLERHSVDTGVIQFGGSLVKFILYALLIFNISTYFGVKESSVAALLGTAGVTVGLAMQGGLANIAGGMMLLIFRPFQVGDYILVGQQAGCEGTVSKIEICYTTLLSIDNKQIVVPNGTLSNSIVTNVTAQERRRLEIRIGVSYHADISGAKKVLEKVLKEDKDIFPEEMSVFVDELGESAVKIGLRAWVNTDSYWPVRWRLNERIKEEFDQAGIEIPYSQLDVHINRE